MQTPEIEPLTVAARGPGARTSSTSSVGPPSATPRARRCAGSCPKSQRAGGDRTSGVDEPHLPRDVGLGDAALARPARTSASADGDSVAIIARTRPEWTISDLASLALGAVTCPIYPAVGAGPGGVRHQQRAARRSIFVENAQQAAKIESIRSECPTLEHVISLRGERQAPRRDADARRRHGARRHGCREPATRGGTASTTIDRDHLATVIHTSGTTANPKGAMLSHGNLLFNFEAANQVVDFYETDVFLAFLPLSHIYGRIVDEVVALGRGAAVVFAEALIERLPANMVEVKPTVMGSVPRLYERVYARVLAPSRRVTDAPADLPLGGGPRREEVRQPPRGQGRLALADSPAEGRRCARLRQDPRADRRPGAVLRLRLGAPGAGDRRVLLRHGHARARGLRADRDVAVRQPSTGPTTSCSARSGGPHPARR